VNRLLPRASVRLRLTLLYGGLFLLAGAGLLALNYALFRSHFTLPFQVETAAAQTGLPALPDPAGRVVVFITRSGQKLVAAAPGQSRASVEAVRSDLEQAALNQILTQSGVALGLMALVSVGLGWLVAGRVLGRLSAITATARRLEGSTLHERINLQGPQDELKELADTFDQMLARLDAAFESQRRFVANASHELRTPLAITRTETDVALADPDASQDELRAMAERVREASERSERLIEGLLTLARSERQLRTREPVDLSVAGAEALSAAGPETEALGLRVIRVLGRAPVTGDRALLERLVANLVENAVRHNLHGGWLEVGSGMADGRAVIRVANGGRPIPPEQVSALFEPFRRLDGDRTGSGRGAGLGLSIVRSVAAAHGGRAAARALDGGGLEVTVELPRAPRPRGGRRVPARPALPGRDR
jgi:signal transduction histidine kinase